MHFVHSKVPDWTRHPIGKWMIAHGEDPDCKELPPKRCRYHQEWVRDELGFDDGMLPREFYAMLEAQERYTEEEDYLKTGNGEPSSPLADGVGGAGHGLNKEALYGGKEYKSRRGLLSFNGNQYSYEYRGRNLLVYNSRDLLVFDLRLEVLYERDCFSDPKNILCIPQIPLSWKLPRWNTTAFFLTEDLDENPTCERFGWKATDCIVCWEGFINGIREVQFLIYWLDLISIILIIGLFLPRPSEALGILGKTFPPLSPFIDWFLLFPAGTFPPGAAWACWFINLYYLFQLIIALLIVYFIISPLLEWARRHWLILQNIWIAWRAGMLAHRSDLEYYNEQRLAIIEREYTRQLAYEQRLAVTPAQPVRIGSQVGAPRPGDAVINIGSEVHEPQPAMYTSSVDLRKTYHLDPAANKMIFDLEKAIGENLASIRKMSDELSDRLGVDAADAAELSSRAHDSSNSKARKLARVIYLPEAYQRVTSMWQIAPEITPAYVEALIQRERGTADRILPSLDNMFKV